MSLALLAVPGNAAGIGHRYWSLQEAQTINHRWRKFLKILEKRLDTLSGQNGACVFFVISERVMSNHGTPGSANGRHDPVTRFAVVINTNVMRQIETRAALRETELFSHTFSCESIETARDVLEHDGTEVLSLIVLDASLADACLPLMSGEQLARTILTHEPDVNVEYDLIAMPHPVSSSVLLDVIGRLQWPDNRDQ